MQDVLSRITSTLRRTTDGKPMSADQYVCGICGTRYVVRLLARDCEAKHETETNP